MQNPPNITPAFAGYLITCVLLFLTAVARSSPPLIMFAFLFLLLGAIVLTRHSRAGTVTPYGTAPQTSAIDDIQEMRQAINNLDRLHEIPDRPSSAYSYQSSGDARYARSQPPDAPPPAWRTGPEEFPLGTLDRIGRPPRPVMWSHAITAAENAGCDYHNSGMLVVDLGLLVYSGDAEQPAVYREAPIPDDASYIQPFAELWLQEPLKGANVRLMLLGPNGRLHFVSEPNAERKGAGGSGRYTVLSPTRLPIGDHLPAQSDAWSLRVEVRGKRIAEHKVNWYTRGASNALIEHMATDGELTVDLAVLLTQNDLTPLSLDELLNGGTSEGSVR